MTWWSLLTLQLVDQGLGGIDKNLSFRRRQYPSVDEPLYLIHEGIEQARRVGDRMLRMESGTLQEVE